MDKVELIQKLIADGLEEIDRKYGPNGTHPLAYHNVQHAKDVMHATKLIAEAAAKAGKIKASEVQLLELAACYHDYGHDMASGENELTSARALSEKMSQSEKFEYEEIEMCKSCILATNFRIEGDKILQDITDDFRTKIVADADLAALGSEWDLFWDRAQKFFIERNLVSPIAKQNMKDYITQEIDIVKNHRYHTPEAEDLFPHRRENVERLKIFAKKF